MSGKMLSLIYTMRSTKKPRITIILVLWLISISTGEERISPFARVESRIVDDILYIYWRLNSIVENSSNNIRFHVMYCQFDDYDYYNQNCKINFTICEANYTGSPLYGQTSTRQENVYEYLANVDYKDKVIRNDTSTLLSSTWNNASRQFSCAIENIKGCKDPILMPDKLGDFMITTSVNYAEVVEIRLDKDPRRRLTKPESIIILQNNSDVTIKWNCSYKCINDVPDSYLISFKSHKDGQEIIWKELPTYGRLLKYAWKHKFTSLNPFTTYTVYVYWYVRMDKTKGPIGNQTFTTAEAAPSKAPTIRCSACVPSTFFHLYRNVTVMWDLPPRNTWNGVIRLTILRFWEDGNLSTTSILKVRHNFTVTVLTRLKQQSNYKFQVKVCTKKNHCSPYSGQSDILEDVAYTQSGTGLKSNSKAWIIHLFVGLTLAFSPAILVILCFYFNRRRKRKNSQKDKLNEMHLEEDPYLPKSTEQTNSSEEYEKIPDNQKKNERDVQEENKSEKENSTEPENTDKDSYEMQPDWVVSISDID